MRLLSAVFLAASITLPTCAWAQYSVNDIGWLSGCWHAVGAEAGSVEHWLAPAGGSMLGVARTVRKGKTVAFEFMQIHEDKGALIFTAKPSAKPEASFMLLTLDKQKVVFENLRPEFPQRIIYHLQANGSLLGRIEGRLQEQDLDKGIDYPMLRVSCAEK